MNTQLDQKINDQFPGVVVRKDLVKQVKGNAIVPSYVLEYLLGQYCATSDEASIQSGVETVKEILRTHYVHRNEAGLVRSTIRERGRHKVIDKISVDLNDKRDAYEATFANLGIKEVLVDADTVKRHPKLLVSGVWSIADLEYQFYEGNEGGPWILNSLKPIQLSRFDFEQYVEARGAFTTDEWIDLLLQSIGFDPALFDRRTKLLQLVRLVPYCERNYNLIELGPKGTGKSHIYTEFSPHGILISGGEVTVAKLFVNNATGRIGLVGFWDVVAFDEFAGKKKRADRALVDILKNYMANKSFSRGIETLGAEASMAYVGNTQQTLPHMLQHSDLFAELPAQYHDSAFLDRLHFYLPGWEVEIIRGEMFSEGYGFVVDYLAEILRHLRNYDYSQQYADHFELMSDISTRDRTSIQKTFSGMMKLVYPHQEATTDEVEELLRFAVEGRKRVKDQLMRIDPTYAGVSFAYTDRQSDQVSYVQTREETLYPQHYHSRAGGDGAPAEILDQAVDEVPLPVATSVTDLIAQGESATLEFKSSFEWDMRQDMHVPQLSEMCIKTVAAFLNSSGGTLLVGVADDGSIVGLEQDIARAHNSLDGLQLKMMRKFTEHIGTEFSGLIDIHFETVDDQTTAVVNVQKASRPAFVKKNDFYIRSANATRQLSTAEALEYITMQR